ncbi:MAG: hypothetical protein IJ094_07935 [Bacilli bacterium]|nr:hypothetical protein [Bacilli bacterium]
MGKSFNDDVFNNNLNLDTINGLNISQEAIQENKKAFSDIEKGLKEKFSNLDLDKVKEEMQATKEAKTKEDDEQELTRLQDEIARLKEKEQQQDSNKIKEQNNNEIYTKKTMIFKQEYLDIIDGLAIINDMQIKDVLNQLLEKSINMLDDKTKEKALKSGRKAKPVKTTKNIF